MVTGRNLDVVQRPLVVVWVEPETQREVRKKRRQALLNAKQQGFNSSVTTVRSANQRAAGSDNLDV